VSDVEKVEQEARKKAQREQERQDRTYDLELLKKAEAALAEIDRTGGLINRHADVLAALRIRIEGGPRKSLEELMTVVGEISGKKGSELDARIKAEESRKKGDLSDLLAREPKKKTSLDDLLGDS
jgi:hypothetical protein